ncbi:hypothetical protein SteCoe_26492 [Stentor coeruleus]|uniref:Uncharacterized protein n=1 Tax=Stentor coeruleus TaxID=5963 RepID=A0A1R2BCZ4_9CILI|nr:hypothetical protein SteCoe_26492 [Stentor coeruleus]
MQDQFELFNYDNKPRDTIKIDHFKGKEEVCVSPQIEKIKFYNQNCINTKKNKLNTKKSTLALKPISELKQVFNLSLPKMSFKGATSKNIKHKSIRASKASKNFGRLTERSHNNEEIEDDSEYPYKEVLDEEIKLNSSAFNQNLRARHLEINSHSCKNSMNYIDFQNTFQSYPENPYESIQESDEPILPQKTEIPFALGFNTNLESPISQSNLYEIPSIIPSKSSLPISQQNSLNQMLPPKLGVPQPWSNEWVLSSKTKPQIPNPNLNPKLNFSSEDPNYVSLSEDNPLILKSNNIIFPNMHSLPPPPLKASQYSSGSITKFPLPMNNPLPHNMIISEKDDLGKMDFFIPPPPLFNCPPVNFIPVINCPIVQNTSSSVVEDNNL